MFIQFEIQFSSTVFVNALEGFIIHGEMIEISIEIHQENIQFLLTSEEDLVLANLRLVEWSERERIPAERRILSQYFECFAS